MHMAPGEDESNYRWMADRITMTKAALRRLLSSFARFSSSISRHQDVLIALLCKAVPSFRPDRDLRLYTREYQRACSPSKRTHIFLCSSADTTRDRYDGRALIYAILDVVIVAPALVSFRYKDQDWPSFPDASKAFDHLSKLALNDTGAQGCRTKLEACLDVSAKVRRAFASSFGVKDTSLSPVTGDRGVPPTEALPTERQVREVYKRLRGLPESQYHETTEVWEVASLDTIRYADYSRPSTGAPNADTIPSSVWEAGVRFRRHTQGKKGSSSTSNGSRRTPHPAGYEARMSVLVATPDGSIQLALQYTTGGEIARTPDEAATIVRTVACIAGMEEKIFGFL